MNLALVVLLIGVAATHAADVPAFALTAVRNAGLQVLSNDIQSANQALQDAVEAFKPVNASCMVKYDQAIEACRWCVRDKCTARAKEVCKPEEWQLVLVNTINFFKSDIPNFFVKSIPDVFVNKIGGGLVDVTKDVGDFFKDKIGGGIVDVGTKIGDGVVDFGKDIGSGVVDFGKDIGKIAVDGFNTVKDGVKDAVDAIGDLGKTIGKTLGDIIGKRRLMRLRREAEPGCSQLKSNASTACQVYVRPAYCPACDFNPKADCDGYEAALNVIQSANAARTWMSKITNQQFTINKLTFNPTNIDDMGNFRSVQAEVHLFGRDLSFTLSQAINPYLPDVAGPAIAQQALGLFKTSD